MLTLFVKFDYLVILVQNLSLVYQHTTDDKTLMA